jgi:hypothetical protein
LDEYVRYRNDERVSGIEVSFGEATSSFIIYKYFDRKPWLTEEILLANKPPACMLDAMASPRTLSATEPSRIY